MRRPDRDPTHSRNWRSTPVGSTGKSSRTASRNCTREHLEYSVEGPVPATSRGIWGPVHRPTSYFALVAEALDVDEVPTCGGANAHILVEVAQPLADSKVAGVVHLSLGGERTANLVVPLNMHALILDARGRVALRLVVDVR